MAFYAGSGNSVQSGTSCPATHGNTSGLDGKRSVLAVLTTDLQSVSSVLVTGSGAPGGWTLRATYSDSLSALPISGRKWTLYDKICDASEPAGYNVTFTPAIVTSFHRNDVATYIADFTTDGDAIRASTSVPGGAGSTLTFPFPIQADGADDLCALVWNDPAFAAGQLLAVSPLIGSDSIAFSLDFWTQLGHQNYRSSAPANCSFACASGTFNGAFAVMMLVGETSVGGWGVGMVRMGAN